ncbi:hypothetical protein BKA62DRAFT_776129, partial [Auriculariales sp. MPI-PUGE-AT-0066]
PGNHSIVQVSAADPCTPLANGFASPVSLVPGASFQIVIDDADQPIYFACGTTGDALADDHCQAGEVGVINALPGDIDTTDVFDAASLVAQAELQAHDGAMNDAPKHGTAYGTGVGAHVYGYFASPYAAGGYNPSDYSLPPDIYPGTSAAPAFIPTPSPIPSDAVLLLAALGIWRAVSVKNRKKKTEVFKVRISRVFESEPREIGDVDAAMRERQGATLGVQPKIEV